MKNKFLLFLLLSTATTYSQSYHTTLENGVMWQINYQGMIGYGSFTATVTGDTIIGGTNYKKIYSDGGGGVQLFREDSLSKRIYMRRNSGQEDLLFDFSLNLNDSISINWFNGFIPSWVSYTYHVDSISQTNIQSGTRKLIRLHSNSALEPNLYWMESVGNIYVLGPLFYNSSGIDYPYDTVVCQQRNGNLSFQYSPSIPCSSFTGISNPSQNTMQVDLFPNPVSTNLFLNIINKMDDECYWKIYDELGTVVLENETFYSKNNINVSQLSSGLYFINLKIGDTVVLRKFMKE